MDCGHRDYNDLAHRCGQTVYLLAVLIPRRSEESGNSAALNRLYLLVRAACLALGSA